VIPTPLWIVLIFIAIVIFAFMLFFADSNEGRATQGLLMGSVSSVIVAMLLLIHFLDNPFHDGGAAFGPLPWSGRSASSTRRSPPPTRP